MPVRHLLYTGPGKRPEEVRGALARGIGAISVDSVNAIEQVQRSAGAGRAADLLLRVNGAVVAPGSLTMTGTPSAFGVDVDQVLAAPARYASAAAGLQFYVASNLAGVEALVAQFRESIATARRIADATGVTVRLLDLGGGFPAPYARRGELPDLSGLRAELVGMLDPSFPGWRAGSPVVAFESGRYLTASCGSLITRVADTKRSHGRRVVVLESGINHLGGMSGLRRVRPIAVEVEGPAGAGPADGPSPGAAAEDAMVCGPLCTPLDLWNSAALLPPVAPGDRLRVPNVGAYGLSASLLAFLGHPAPDEVVTDHGVVLERSRLETVRTWDGPRPDYEGM